jgi:hypothetical protein
MGPHLQSGCDHLCGIHHTIEFPFADKTKLQGGLVLHEEQGHARLRAHAPVGKARRASLDVLRGGGRVSELCGCGLVCMGTHIISISWV